MKKNKLLTLEEFKHKHYGEKGSTKRDNLESGFEAFKIGSLIHEARLGRGMTQEIIK